MFEDYYSSVFIKIAWAIFRDGYCLSVFLKQLSLSRVSLSQKRYAMVFFRKLDINQRFSSLNALMPGVKITDDAITEL